jgi:hypothetical protein
MKTKRTRFMGVNNQPQTSGNRVLRCIHAAHTLAYLSSSQCVIYSKSMNMYLISRQKQHILPTGTSRPPAPQRFVVAIQSIDTPREIPISLRSKFCTALLHTPKRKTSQSLHLRNCLATTFTIKQRLDVGRPSVFGVVGRVIHPPQGKLLYSVCPLSRLDCGSDMLDVRKVISHSRKNGILCHLDGFHRNTQ